MPAWYWCARCQRYTCVQINWMQLFVPNCTKYKGAREKIDSKKDWKWGKSEKKTCECWKRDKNCIGMGEVSKMDSKWLMWTIYIRGWRVCYSWSL